MNVCYLLFVSKLDANPKQIFGVDSKLILSLFYSFSLPANYDGVEMLCNYADGTVFMAVLYWHILTGKIYVTFDRK